MTGFTISEILATQDRTVRMVADDEGGFRLAKDEEDALVTFTWRPGAFTPRKEMEIQERATSAASNDFTWIADYLPELISHWDVETDEHKPYPLTSEAMADLPSAVLIGILSCIREDATVPKASSSGSGSGSARTRTDGKASSARSRAGMTRSSASRVRRAS